jgi:hypothetical protein
MNREDIIKMAREAGLSGLMEGGLIDYFERFAALVAAAEREACARVCRDLGRGHGVAFAEFDCVEAIRARGQE